MTLRNAVRSAIEANRLTVLARTVGISEARLAEYAFGGELKLGELLALDAMSEPWAEDVARSCAMEGA